MHQLTNADDVSGTLAMMLTREDMQVNAPEASELSVAHVFSTCCCNCDLPAHQNAADTQDAVSKLNTRGWRSITTSSDHYPMLCPGCVLELQGSQYVTP